MKQRITKTFGILIAAATIAVFLWPRPTVDSVMNDFLYNDSQRAEDMLMDPLILHADLVKDRVIEEIKNPRMEKRRYAIGFLGVARIKTAAPVLRAILEDEAEIDYFRADALVSIYQNSREDGLYLAKKYMNRNDILGHAAKQLLDGSFRPFERTYNQALIGHHE